MCDLPMCFDIKYGKILRILAHGGLARWTVVNNTINHRDTYNIIFM